jgi:hypothetical protein
MPTFYAHYLFHQFMASEMDLGHVMPETDGLSKRMPYLLHPNSSVQLDKSYRIWTNIKLVTSPHPKHIQG